MQGCPLECLTASCRSTPEATAVSTPEAAGIDCDHKREDERRERRDDTAGGAPVRVEGATGQELVEGRAEELADMLSRDGGRRG